MTGEESERAIEFLLKSQASLEGQIAETNRIVQMHAETQTEFIQIVTKALGDLADAQRRAEARASEAFSNLAEAQRRADARAAEAISHLADAQRRTDERIAKVEERSARRYDDIDARLDRLVGVVERLAGGRDTE
jgi:hypothetical protein